MRGNPSPLDCCQDRQKAGARPPGANPIGRTCGLVRKKPVYAPRRMNFARDVVDAAPPARRALVALGRDGSRTGRPFGEVAHAPAFAPAALASRAARRGAVAMAPVRNPP